MPKKQANSRRQPPPPPAVHPEPEPEPWFLREEERREFEQLIERAVRAVGPEPSLADALSAALRRALEAYDHQKKELALRTKECEELMNRIAAAQTAAERGEEFPEASEEPSFQPPPPANPSGKERYLADLLEFTETKYKRLRRAFVAHLAASSGVPLDVREDLIG